MATKHVICPTSVTLQPPQLPRELFDAIISALITLHDHDPTYQWVKLRHITHHHKTEVEQHFADCWLPRLILRMTDDINCIDYVLPENHIEYNRDKDSNESESNDGVMFMPEVGYGFTHDLSHDQLAGWQSAVMRTTYPGNDEQKRSKALIVILRGVPLDEGYTGGGIFSDGMAPGLSMDPTLDPWDIHFDWRLLFTNLFGEEMLMRRFRDRLLESFLPTLEVPLPEDVHNAILQFLSEHYQEQRRGMLADYRNYIANNTHSHRHPFDIMPYLSMPKIEHPPTIPTGDYPSIFDLIRTEESMVFQIPGWRTWSIREIARLRAIEDKIEDWMYPLEDKGPAGEEYFEEMIKRENEMLGKKVVSEEILDGHLRGPRLDPGRFWDW